MLARVRQVLDALAMLLVRHSWIGLTLFSVVFLSVTAWLGSTKPMEFDEIFTYYPARQAAVADVWSFFSEGLDTNTPVAAVLAHASLRIFGDTHLALRLPVIFGYWLLCLCLYAFVSYRCSPLYGMAAMLLPPVTSAYFYATEARAYGVVLGASALALVSWQRATGGGRRWLWLTLLAVSLALCISLHYLCIFLWAPLGLAELVRLWERKKLDWGVAAALVAGLAPLGAFLPMMLLARQNFLGGFWARPSLSDVENTYRYIFTLAFTPMLGTVIAWLLVSRGEAAQQNGAVRLRAPLAERVLIGALALTPVYVVPAMLVGGIFVPRYVLFTLTGVTIFLATAAYERARGSALFAITAIVCLGGWFVVKYPAMARRQMVESRGLPFGKARPLEAKPWMRAIEARPELPVVLNPAVFFLHFQHYSPPEVRQRSYYLTSLSDAMRLDGADTGDRNLLFFSRRFPVQVPAYAEFVEQHRSFLLCAETTNPTWVLEKLLEDGAELRLLLRDSTYHLYHVTFPGH